MNKLAVIGARTSSDDSERDSIDSQLAECRTFAEGLGYEVVDELREENVSGGLPVDARAELLRGLELLRSGRVHAIIYRSPDRLGRRADTGQLVVDHCVFNDGIRFVRTPQIDDPVAEAILRSGFTGFAEAERKVIYARTSAGRNRRARSGEGVGIGVLPPWLAWSGTEFVKVEPAATETRKLILEAARTTPHDAAQRRDLHPAKIYGLLHNPVVAGLRCILPLRPTSVEAEYRDRESLARRRIRREALRKISQAATVEEAVEIAAQEGLIVQRVPPLVTWEQFAKVQARLRDQPSKRGRPAVQRLPLLGRVFCAEHGLAYTAERAGGQRGNIFAVCTASKAASPQAKKHGQCHGPRVPWLVDSKGRRALVALVEEKLDSMLSSPEGFRRAAEDSLAGVRARIDQLEAETGDVESEIARLKDKRARIGLLWADGSIDDARWKSERERIDRQIAAAERRAATAGDRLQQLAQARHTANLLEKLQAAGVPALTANIGAESLDQRAARIDLKVYVHADRLELQAAVPLDDAPLAVRGIRVRSRRG